MTEPVREPDSPYVGLEAFGAAHADYFFGRSLDSAVLADNVLARPITVLYGASGVGKSSVLNVGLPRAFSELGVTARIVSRSKWYEPALLGEWLHQVTQSAPGSSSQPLVIILDQFEEYFLYANTDQIKAFAKLLATLVGRKDLETHVLFALRDDGLHRLDALRLDLPTLLDTTLELRHLDESSVREAIERPIAAWNERHSQPITLDTGFAASLVAQLCPKNLDGQPIKDGRIELAYLQLALEKIWEAEGGASATALRTSTLTERLKGVSEIARRHVEEVLGELKEEGQAVCATVFDRLVTPSGGKIAYATADLAAVAKVSPDRMEAVLSPLASGKSRILRAVTMPGRLNTKGYEILHDVLARPILDWREQRATQVERERADAEALARRHVERDRQRLARTRAYLLGVVAVLAIAMGVAVWAGLRARRAEDAARASEETARRSSVRAQALRLTAEGQFLLSNANDERGLLELIAAARIVRANEIDSALLSALLARRDMLTVINTGHGRVVRVAVTHDGRGLVSGGSDGTLRLWDARTGQPIGAPLHGHRGRVESVAVTPDGRRLISGGEDGTLRLWDAQTGQPIGAPLTGHRDGVLAVAVTPDGRRLISGGEDGTLRLWDAQTGQPIGAPLARQAVNLPNAGQRKSIFAKDFLKDLENWVPSVAVTADGRRLVSGGNDGMLRLWDAQTGQPIGAPLTGHQGSVQSVAITLDGRLVSAGSDGTLRFWDAQTGQPIGAPLTGHQGSVQSVAVTPDGRRLVSGGRDGTLHLWDAQTGQPIGAPVIAHQDWVWSVAVTPDGRLVSGGADGTLRLWAAQPGLPIGAAVAGQQDWILSVAVTPDGRRLVTGGSDGTLRLRDAQTGQPIGAPLIGHSQVQSVAVTPDGRRLVSGGNDFTVRLWDAQNGQPIGAPLAGHQHLVESVAVTPDGRRLVSGDNGGTLRLWDAQTGQPIGAPLTGHQGWVESVAVTRDSRRLVSGGSDGTVRLWDAQTGQPIGTPITGLHDWVRSVAVTPDGRRLVSGGNDGTLRLWDAQTGQPIGGPLVGHQRPVLSVAVTPDSRRLVSAGEDGTLRLWDAQTGQPIGPPITGPYGWVPSLAVTPDGRRIVSGEDNGTLRLTPAPDAWPDELCSKLTRNMSSKEWREWVSPEIEYISSNVRTCRFRLTLPRAFPAKQP